MDWRMIGQILGPVLAAVVAFVASEWRRIIKDAERLGKAESDSASLTTQFSEFKDSVKQDRAETREEIHRIFQRIDELAKGGYTCGQLAHIGALQTQVATNTERFLRMEQRVHEIEATAAEAVASQELLNDYGRRIGTLEQQRSIRRKPA